MNNINVLILLFLSVNFVNSAIQLDNSCLKRPQACDDDAFSVADFLICGGSAYGAEVPNAKKGTGKKGSGCSFTENCVEVFPTDELDTGASAWGSNPVDTCNDATANGKLQLNGHWPTNTDLANELGLKRAACAKWMAAGTAVCQPAAWFPWTIVGVLLSLVGGLVFYFYRKKNKQYKAKASKKGGSAKLYSYHRRNARVFEDGI